MAKGKKNRKNTKAAQGPEPQQQQETPSAGPSPNQDQPAQSRATKGILEPDSEPSKSEVCLPVETPQSLSKPAQTSKQTIQMASEPVTVLKKLEPMSKCVGTFDRPFASAEVRKANCGKEGKPIKLLANHFPVKVSLECVTHYQVELKVPEFKRPIKKSESELAFRAFWVAVNSHPHVFPSPHSVVFDGMSNAFSATPLKFANNSNVFKTNVTVKEVPDLDREVKVEIAFQRTGQVVIKDAIEEFQRRGRTEIVSASSTGGHESAVQALNVILGMVVRMSPDFVAIGRRHFPDKPGVIELGQGKSLWVGTFKSVRIGWKLALNVDMANRPGYEKQNVLDFMCKFFERPSYGQRQQQQGLRYQDLEGVLRKEWDRRRVSDELKGLKIRFNRPKGGPREYRANCLTREPAERLMLEVEGQGKISLVQYFRSEFDYKMKWPKLPCLHVGNVKRTIYWPPELCDIKKQAAPNNKKLTDDQAAAMIRQTAMRPQDRMKRIIQNLKEMAQAYKLDPYAKAFGISVDSKMKQVPGRVLTAPSLNYVKDKQTKEAVFPKDGKWRMNPHCRFVNSQELKIWGVLTLSDRVTKDQAAHFVDDLYSEGGKCGFKIDYPIHSSAKERDANDIESKFVKLFETIKKDKNVEKPQLIMVICNAKGPAYNLVKHLGDVILGMPTQFVLAKNVLPNPKTRQISPQTLHNICLKLNSKLGGTNQVLAVPSLPDVLRRPVMVMGADVTHPAPGESAQKKPSIAAVVANYNPGVSLFHTEVSLQPGEQAIEEIVDLEAMVMRLLRKFYDANRGRKPERIVFYRDGVSEGQFNVVLAKELSAIQRACRTLEKDYEPGITFVVAQKRHNTRLFPEDQSQGVGKVGNVPPGTVVDTDITHPTETSFFLASHEGIQGTTRPTHYHLLSDDNGFSSDELQRLTYFLCHLYSRCERSVSYPAPTYYAHLAAFRARGHHNALEDKGQGQNKEEWKKIEQMAVVNHFV